MNLTSEMCEFVGAIIGDGNIYDRRPYYVEMSGHPSEDLLYFKKRLINFVEKELNYIPKIYFHSGAVRFRVNNKKFVLWLKNLGIPTGRLKCHNVLIPEDIYVFWDKARNCIRGIFDTDGCIHFDKRPAYYKPYPRIELHILNENLLKQICNILKIHGFNVTKSKKKSSIYLNGFKEVKKFLVKIGFANPKHHQRIKRLYPKLITYNLI